MRRKTYKVLNETGFTSVYRKNSFLQTLFSSHSLFQPHRSLVRNSALGKTHLLFIQAKQHVVFLKTTRYFPQNDTSLSPKRHVVFTKTTRHFHQNNTSVEEKQAQGIFFDRKINCAPFNSKSFLIDQSAYLNTLATRARVRTHYRDFLFFAVTSVTLQRYLIIFQ